VVRINTIQENVHAISYASFMIDHNDNNNSKCYTSSGQGGYKLV